MEVKYTFQLITSSNDGPILMGTGINFSPLPPKANAGLGTSSLIKMHLSRGAWKRSYTQHENDVHALLISKVLFQNHPQGSMKRKFHEIFLVTLRMILK